MQKWLKTVLGYSLWQSPHPLYLTKLVDVVDELDLLLLGFACLRYPPNQHCLDSINLIQPWRCIDGS